MSCKPAKRVSVSAPSDNESVPLSATVAKVAPRGTVAMKSKAFSWASVRFPSQSGDRDEPDAGERSDDEYAKQAPEIVVQHEEHPICRCSICAG